jgi:hypothetical protein
MRLLRARKTALSLALGSLCAVEGVASRAADLASTSADAQPVLRIDTSPLDAHVYVRRDSGQTIHACTGPCTLILASGAYRIDAGLMHRELIRAAQPLTLRPGDDRWLNVAVRENTARNNVGIALLVAGAAGLVVGLPVAIVQGGTSSFSPWSVGGALVIGGGLCGLAGMAVMALFDPAVVELRQWTDHVPGGQP